MQIEYCSIGHVSLDSIESKTHVGGSVLFGSQLAHDLGFKTGAVTSSAVDFPFSDYSDIEWSIQFAAKTTKYKHEYSDDKRLCQLTNRADRIIDSSIGKALRNSKIVMASPILDEVTPELLMLFQTPWIGLTPQGWFRKFDIDGNMSIGESIFQKLPKKLKLIVVSQEDIIHDSKSWDWIKQSAEVAVCTMGKKGYILNDQGGEREFSPLEVMKEKNPTGCGDIFATSTLLLLHKGMEPSKACEFAGQAAAMASTQHDVNDSIAAAKSVLIPLFR